MEKDHTKSMGFVLLSCFCGIIVVWYRCWTTTKGNVMGKDELNVLLSIYEKLKDDVQASDLKPKSKEMLVTLLSKEASLSEVRSILNGH